MVKGLKVGDEVVWVVGNIIKGRREERRFDVVILALPDRNNAQIECALNGKPYKVTIKRSHLEPKGAPQKAVSRALDAVLRSGNSPQRGALTPSKKRGLV
jgi:hypothetical protein